MKLKHEASGSIDMSHVRGEQLSVLHTSAFCQSALVAIQNAKFEEWVCVLMQFVLFRAAVGIDVISLNAEERRCLMSGATDCARVSKISQLVRSCRWKSVFSTVA